MGDAAILRRSLSRESEMVIHRKCEGLCGFVLR